MPGQDPLLASVVLRSVFRSAKFDTATLKYCAVLGAERQLPPDCSRSPRDRVLVQRLGKMERIWRVQRSQWMK